MICSTGGHFEQLWLAMKTINIEDYDIDELLERKKEGDIGYDAYTCESKVIKAHSADKVSLGIGMVIPVGFGVHARNRSGNYIGKTYNSPIDIGDAWVDNNYRGIIISDFDNWESDKNVKRPCEKD